MSEEVLTVQTILDDSRFFRKTSLSALGLNCGCQISFSPKPNQCARVVNRFSTNQIAAFDSKRRSLDGLTLALLTGPLTHSMKSP